MLKRLEELKQQQKQLEEIITIKENLLNNFNELANAEMLNLIKKISGYEYIKLTYTLTSAITNKITDNGWRSHYDYLSIYIYDDNSLNWKTSFDFNIYIYKDEVEVSSGMVCRNYSDGDVYFKTLKTIISIIENKNLILDFANNKLSEHRKFIKEVNELERQFNNNRREILNIEDEIIEDEIIENLKVGQRYEYLDNLAQKRLTGNYFIVQKITNKTVVILPQENNSIYNSYYDNKIIKKNDIIFYIKNKRIKLMEEK